jgi:hypothetical protein
MKFLVLPLSLVAGLILLPCAVQAFEVYGEDASLADGGAPFSGLNQGYVMPEFKGSSLAMPYISKDSGYGGHVSDYGNSIPIPGPGISLPSPAWAYGPSFR